MKEDKESNGFGITSLVTSIIGFVLFIAPYLGICFSITGIVFAVLQNKKHKNGLATAGLVVGILGVVGNSIWLLLVVFLLALGV
jgi:uncharacterized membrane protein YccF (DUF307 family)